MILFFLLLFSLANAKEFGKVSTKKVAEGIYLFTTTPYGDVGMSGNTVAILTNDSVVLFDSSATPQTAENILAEIRKLSDKPVSHLVNSHWHWDHWGGNQVFFSSFPELEIISHQKTLEQMKTVEPRWNDQGLKDGLPAYLQDFEKRIAEAKANQTPESKIKELEELLEADRNFLNQKISLKKTYPNTTFSESRTFSSGGREIQILHARAITAGDAYLYLPKEKILITGDIILSPFPYAIGGTYPADWLKTLKYFAGLKPALIIPGHGDVQNPAFIQANILMFQKALDLVKEAKAKRLTLDQTKESVAKQAAELGKILGITELSVLEEFKAYFLNVFVSRAYKELEQRLGELPDGLPE